jgi:4-amino-4-deoxy-L-arabinose transferase-like glycosyltransferase
VTRVQSPATRPRRTTIATAAFLAAIVLLGGFLRLDRLGEAHSLNQDEALSAYDAYSIWKTGRDSWGAPYPLVFREYGAFTNQVQVYLTVPAVMLLGLDERSARLPWTLLGSLSPIVAFLIGRELAGAGAGLIAALLVAVSPWAIFVSRFAMPSNLVYVFTGAGVACLTIGLRRPAVLVASAGCFLLAVHTYSSALLFVPLFLAGAALLLHRELARAGRLAAVGAALLALGTLPVVWVHLRDPATNWVLAHFAAYTRDGRPSALAVLANFAAYFRPEALFDADGRIEAYAYAGNGFLPLAIVPLLGVGLVLAVVRARHDRRYLLLLWWIVAAAASLALTRSPSTRRFNIAIPAFEVIAGIGGAFLGRALLASRGAVRAAAAVTLGASVLWIGASAVSFRAYLRDELPVEANRAPYFGYGWKEAVQFAEAHPEYDRVCGTAQTTTSSQPYVYVLFYTRYDPATFQKQRAGKQIVKEGGWTAANAVGSRYVFRYLEYCDRAKNPLYILNPTERPDLRTIRVLADESGYAPLRIAERRGSGPTGGS